MSYAVSYYCPNCETLVELRRTGYLDDKAVTPYPFEGWTYAAPDEPFEDGAADGVRFVCGESAGEGVEWQGEGCGEPFYLSFVRFAEGEELDPRNPSERVELNLGTSPPSPRGPERPGGPDGA